MTAAELLSHLHSLDIRLRLEGERLRYSAPNGALTPTMRAQLAEHKTEIIAFLRRAEGVVHSTALPSIPPISRDADAEIPVSLAQQRLWFLEQLEPGNAAYNIPTVLRLAGSLDVSVLQQSLDEIVRRHEALRTTFGVVEDRPVQVVAPELKLALPLVDLSEVAKTKRAAFAWRFAAQEGRSPFDLTRGPLVRAILLRLANREHWLLLTIHHIVFDAWSLGVLIQELAALYDAFSDDKQSQRAGRKWSPLPELPIQYADFAVRQREWLQGKVLETQLAYWQRQLDGLGALELPTDRPRPLAQTFQGAVRVFDLSGALTQALQTLSQQQECTLFMTLLAAFKTLLYRYTGQADVAVGSPIANRNRKEIAGLIGFFVNTLVMRTDLSGNPTFRELLGRVREVALGAYAHQDVPFEMLVDELQPQRDLSRSPLFQVMFVLQNAPMPDSELQGLTLSVDGVDNKTAKFDLTLSIWPIKSGLRAVLEYNVDLFDATTIAHIAGHLQTLLEGIVEDADRRLADLPILTQQEQRQLLVAWNESGVEYPRDACIPELFKAQAERTPDRVALVFEDQSVTFRDLDRRANQLAHYLQGLGVGPEVLVGVCMERCPEMLVGLIGVLKAGGAYVPLDPAYPQKRLAFMLEDTGAKVLLAQDGFVDELPPHNAQVVCLDADWEAVARMPRTAPPFDATVGHLAYTIYTSGSTGRPKGVAIEHRSATAFIHWARRTFGAERLAGTLASTSICFDLSIFELFVPLTSGATVILVETALHLPALAAAEAVTLVNTVPSVIKELLLADGLPASVRTVNLAGELLRTPLVDQVYQCEGVEQVFDLYGPSEDTTYSTYTLRKAGEPATIGRPIANTQVYLLDAHLQPVPVGVPGELHIGGEGLARGYLKRPALTAERFIPDPFPAGEDVKGRARLYRTGDLARYLPNGDVELLGRIDHQVKVRGFRIELGEVEAVLARHPAVQQTVVVAREDAPGEKRLVAYVVPGPDQTPAAGDLRQFMREKLPDYMLPSNFVTLETLPLTPNKKIDRRALPAPDDTRPDLEQTFVAPRTPLEELVTGIWSQVLGLKQIGIHDNFFELGGHSLLATQVISRLRQAFEVELPLRSLFEAPTVAGLVAGIEAVRGSARGTPMLPMEPVERGRSLSLSFAQQRLWFLDQLDPGNASYNVPVALRLTGQLQVRALVQSLDEIVRRHEALRTTFASVDGKPIQVIAPELKLALAVVDLAGIAGARREVHVRRLAMQEGRLIFDLVRGPLVRATLLRLGHDEHVLLLTIHHIVCDAWSLGVLIRELATLYDAFYTAKSSRQAGRKQSRQAGRRRLPLPELPIQYADFAVRQREWLQGGELEKQLAYWRRQLDALETLDLLTDHPRPPMQTFQGAIQVFKLPGDLTEALRTLSRQEGCTLFMTLLAAFDTLLYRYTGQTDVAVGSPIANRNRKEIEGLIGFFVNTLVIRTDLSGNPTFRELLGRVREVALGAYVHQDVPFEMLVDELQPGRDLSRSPLFQVMFMLQNAPIPEKELDDLSIKAFSVGNETAMFDLSLSIWETGRELSGAFEYNTDLFDAATIARIVGHFQTLLESVVADAHARLSELSLLTAIERQQVLVEWSSTVIDGAPDRCVHELFATQVARTPDAVAVVFPSTSSGRVPSTPDRLRSASGRGPSTPDRLRSASGRDPSTGFARHPGLDERAECDQCLTFRELNRRANQLAHHLRQMGVGPETLVGICVERSLEMVIGLLGIFKAGGAYVPLDPAYPSERLAFILRDTQSPVLVTASPLLPLISNLQSPIPQVVCLDADWEDVARASEENPPGEVKSENLAYVIYTSGSTGEPKGVAIQHCSLADYAQTASTEYALESDDRVLQFASISFDASAEEIYASLIRGATLVLRTESMLDTLETFVQKCHDWDITVLHLPTAYWHTMASGLGQDELALPPTVRLVTIGGERAIPERLATWQQHIDRQIRLVNSYGPTETTIVATMCELSGRVEAGVALREVPIGRAVRNAQTFVLDRHLQPAPVGIPGELYIGGGGLARGYLDRPGLTAERFVPNPVSPPLIPPPGGKSRLYRTGDLVRYLADGSLEFLGRTDQQVKVRGFRIELGEIEAVLGKHPAVQETVLLTHDSDSGDRQLVAYIVARPEQQLPNVSELRQFVEQKLPNYMIPSAFVTLETLPLTPSGKIDRRALPAPTGVRPELEKTYVAPSTPYEEILAEVWEEVLGVEKIGVHDNFFDLGGHSLLATQVVSRVRDRFEIDLPVRSLFEAPTIAEMAPRIEQTLIAEIKGLGGMT